MTTDLNEAASVAPRLPFAEFDVAADAGASRYTAPTWVRSSPRGRPARAQRPAPVGKTAVEDVYDELLSALEPEDGIARGVERWAQRAAARLEEAIRVQVGDVSAVVCGSLASGAHVATAPWDVDICVLTYDGRPVWDRDPHAALDDVARWITAAVGATATVNRADCQIAIESTGGLSVDVIVAWATPNAPGAFVRAQPRGGDVELIPCAPTVHCDRLRARDTHLGRNGAFLKVLRIAKHVTRHWAARNETTPLSSFELDVLALDALTQPFEVAEGVPFLFRHAAEAVHGPVPCPFALGGELRVTAKDVAAAYLAETADRCDEAMFATDPGAAAAALGDEFAA